MKVYFFFFRLSFVLSCRLNCARWLWEGLPVYCCTISATLGRTRGSLTCVVWETRVGDLSPWLDPSPLGWGALAWKAEILGRSPPPLPLGTLVPDCSLAGELVAAFFAGRGLLASSSELSSWRVLLLLIVSISISFSSLTSFEAADCRADSVFRIVVSSCCSGVVCGGGGVSSEEGATRGTGFSGVISSNVSNRVRQ